MQIPVLNHPKHMDCFHFQHTANNQPSPAKKYPELGSAIMKYLRKEVGEMDSLPKNPCSSKIWNIL